MILTIVSIVSIVLKPLLFRHGGTDGCPPSLSMSPFLFQASNAELNIN